MAVTEKFAVPPMSAEVDFGWKTISGLSLAPA
jgi:hypothetical protein